MTRLRDWSVRRSTHRAAPLATALLAATSLAAGLLTACGGSDGNGGGDRLVVYSGRNENLVAPLIEKFRQASGLAVDVRYGDSAELAAQLLEEGERTPADVFLSQDAGALGAVSDEGLFIELPASTLDRVPPRFRADDGRWVGVSGRSRVVVYDPREVSRSDLPDSVFDLTDPAWRGQLGIAPTNASFQAFVTAMRVLAGEDAARAWLDGIKANDVKIYPNNVEILNAVDRGEIELGLINHYYWHERVKEVGIDGVSARLRYLRGDDPGALVNVAGAGVIAGTDHATSAQQFVDYLLGTEAQTYFAQATFEYPLVEGVPPAEGLTEIDTLAGPDLDLSDLHDLKGTLELLADVGLT